MKYQLLKSLSTFFIFLLLLVACSNRQEVGPKSEVQQVEKDPSDVFVSVLKEPYDSQYDRNVFDDFASANAKSISDIGTIEMEDFRILKLTSEEAFNSFLSRNPVLENLEALQVVNASIGSSRLEALITYLSDKKYFKKLILFHCEISRIPPAIKQLKRLETLDLSLNTISVLPEEVLDLSNLKYLRLYNNRTFYKLPTAIGQLTNLEVLDFAGTQVSTIPKSIGQCQNLIHLTGNACAVKAIPKELASCSKLKLINLGANQIASLPAELSQLSELEILSLGSNAIKQIPKEYERLSNLYTFALDNNQLIVFPNQVLNYQKMLNLWLHKNPIKEVPVEVANLKRLIAFLIDENEFTTADLEAIRKKNPRLKVITRY